MTPVGASGVKPPRVPPELAPRGSHEDVIACANRWLQAVLHIYEKEKEEEEELH